ncbi:hypothetical protein [Rhodopseudomonas sp. P2A-2r]|uniref:hypothetical protein n=1 Tax=Rhodopseudomonas sp. P2A-2r TaxID=2991972 RepID=UPI0029FF1E95|nr:hypothetical protein [Rhodopseudomonas sp. P2A-2r]
MPLPKAPPPRAMATPAKPVAKVPAVAVAPEVKPAVPTVQQAVVAPKPDPDKVRVIPLDAAHAVDAPAEAKPAAPAIAPTEAMPPVQGLD